MQPGQEITVDPVFAKGDVVKVVGTSKGRGFQGVVKRHHFGGGFRTHGQSDRERAPGSIGSSSYPSRVFKGTAHGGPDGRRADHGPQPEGRRGDPRLEPAADQGFGPRRDQRVVEIHKLTDSTIKTECGDGTRRL